MISYCRYKDLSHLIERLGPFNNMVIGTFYYAGSMSLIIRFNMYDNRLELWKRIAIAVSTALGFLMIYLVNLLVSCIPKMNMTIPKLIYPFFYNNKHFRNVRTLIKLDDFVSLLNERYIGFYCFNMFRFTKLAFYQFLFGLSTTYLLYLSLIK